MLTYLNHVHDSLRSPRAVLPCKVKFLQSLPGLVDVPAAQWDHKVDCECKGKSLGAVGCFGICKLRTSILLIVSNLIVVSKGGREGQKGAISGALF